MSQEKSQLENITLPPQDGEATQAPQKAPSALPAGFSLGKQLTTRESVEPLSRMEVLKNSLPKYNPVEQGMTKEERDLRARLEKEEMNYDLYSLIKERLAGEFKENLLENRDNIILKQTYNLLRKNSLFDYIKRDPPIYTPNEKDLIYIASHLKELLADQNISAEDYPNAGAFLNCFIHAYFDSFPEEKRKDLKLNLLNTKGLDFIGSGLTFGELEVEEARSRFGYFVGGSAILKAKKVWSVAGREAHDNAQVLVEEAGLGFGFQVFGSAILRAKKVKDNAGYEARDNVQISVEEAGDEFGCRASGSAILRAKRAKNDVGREAHGNIQIMVEEAGYDTGLKMHGDAKIIIGKSYGSIGGERKDNAQIILPDERVLMPGDSV